MNSKLSLSLTVLATALLLVLLSIPIGPIPPTGSFFHPSEGFWANAQTNAPKGRLTVQAGDLSEPVEIFFNNRGVPHIFARNERDLYFAQGYITARDRLFQLELQVMNAAGRLSEWLGKELAEYDLHQRRLGMVYGAEQTLTTLKGDEIEQMLEAYSKGINAYIRSLSPDQFPLEYKILNIEPEEWTNLKTALFLKNMTQRLAARSQDFQTSNTMAYMGEDFVENYLGRPTAWMDPIIPPEKEWNFDPLERVKPDDNFVPRIVREILPWQPDPANGSNNWAVDGSRTASGHPILTGDPHLNMTLPSIWYEIQLNAPGINVYGYSLPGSPSVIMGFNNDIAWTNTNTGADVKDWYEIEFRDESRREYVHDGEWKPVGYRVEEIRVRNSETVVDTVLYTHHGPVLTPRGVYPDTKDGVIGYALKWIGHFPSDELRTYYKLNRAESVEGAREALGHYTAPAQNFAIADRSGSIALQIAGRFPLKWDGQGQTVGDGRSSLYDWQGWIPYEQNPYVVNPERGFVSSANQEPADESYPYYLGDYYAPFERGRRVNELLAETSQVTTEEMKKMQLDNFNYHAAKALPLMLDHLNTGQLDETELYIFELLGDWNYDNLGNLKAPSVFHDWWSRLYRSVWSSPGQTVPMRYPNRDRTVEMMLEEADAPWFNNPEAENRRTLADHINVTFRETVEQLTLNRGEPGARWAWGEVNRTDLNHSAHIPGLGESGLFTDGGAESINAIRGSHGPSMRFVAELGPEIEAYGVYPGGQTGNPGSAGYNEFVETWRQGDLFKLNRLTEKPGTDDDLFPLVLILE